MTMTMNSCELLCYLMYNDICSMKLHGILLNVCTPKAPRFAFTSLFFITHLTHSGDSEDSRYFVSDHFCGWISRIDFHRGLR